MMEYRTLDASKLAAIQQRKLVEIEREHAALTLNVWLATVAGIDNESVSEARSHLVVLEVQHAALVSRLVPSITIEPNEEGDACAS